MGAHSQWIDVDFTDAWMGCGNLGDRNHGLGERIDIDGGPAAPTPQQRRAGKATQHGAGGGGVHRCHFDGDIPVHLGLGPPRADHHDRPEIGVTTCADEDLHGVAAGVTSGVGVICSKIPMTCLEYFE